MYLNVRVDNQFRESENFAREMESVSESGLLSIFRRQGLDGLDVEVIIEMEVIEIFSVNEEVEHVITLPADLKPGFHLIEFGDLEKLRFPEGFEHVLLVIRSRRTFVQLV